MFCTHCGTEANSQDRFCRSCGRELVSPQATGEAAGTTPAAPTFGSPAAPTSVPSGGQPGPTWSGQPRPALAAPHATGFTPPRTLADGVTEIAPVGRRIAAFTIDLLLIVAGWFGGAFVVAIGYFIANGIPEDGKIPASDEEALSIAIWAVAAPLIFIGTWILNATGGSLGKRMLGLRIVREDGRSPGPGWGLGRTFTAWVSWLPFGLGFLWATWDDQTQTWHDKMCGTYVVRAQTLPNRENRRVVPPGSPGSEGGPGSLH